MSNTLQNPTEHILIIKLENNLLKNPYYLNFNKYTMSIHNVITRKTLPKKTPINNTTRKIIKSTPDKLSVKPQKLQIQKGGKETQSSSTNQALLKKDKDKRELKQIAKLRKEEKLKQKLKQRKQPNIKNYMKIKPWSSENYALGTISKTSYMTEIISNLLKTIFKDKTYTMCVRRPHPLKFINEYTSPQFPKYREPIFYYSGELKCEKANIFDNKNKMYEIIYDAVPFKISSYMWDDNVNAIPYKDIIAEKSGKYAGYYKLLNNLNINENAIIYIPTVHLYLIKKDATFTDKFTAKCDYHKMEIRKIMHKNKLRRDDIKKQKKIKEQREHKKTQKRIKYDEKARRKTKKHEEKLKEAKRKQQQEATRKQEAIYNILNKGQGGQNQLHKIDIVKSLCYGFTSPRTYDIEQNKQIILKWIHNIYTAQPKQKVDKKLDVNKYAIKLKNGESIIIRNKKWDCNNIRK